MNHNDTLKTFLKSVIGNKCINANDQVLNDFLQHVEEIMKDPSKCINVLEKELSDATNDYLSVDNSNDSDRKKEKLEKLDSAQNHLDNISEMTDLYNNLYMDLIKELQSMIETKRKSIVEEK